MLGAKVGKPLGRAVREGHSGKGDLLVTLDPSVFADPDLFMEAVEAHLTEVKPCRKVTDHPPMTTYRRPAVKFRRSPVMCWECDARGRRPSLAAADHDVNAIQEASVERGIRPRRCGVDLGPSRHRLVGFRRS